MALSNMARSTKRPTPAEQAQAFKATQEQMKQDAARRRLETNPAQSTSKRRRQS